MKARIIFSVILSLFTAVIASQAQAEALKMSCNFQLAPYENPSFPIKGTGQPVTVQAILPKNCLHPEMMEKYGFEHKGNKFMGVMKDAENIVNAVNITCPEDTKTYTSLMGGAVAENIYEYYQYCK